MISIDRRLIKNYGWTVLGITAICCVIGLISLYSASYYMELISFRRQIIWMIIGFTAMFAISLTHYSLFNRYSLHIFAGAIFMLILVLFLGTRISGQKSWILLGPMAIQPAEFAKIALVLVIARFYHNDFEDGPFGIMDIIKPVFFTGIIFSLVMLQPDLGTGIIIIAIAGSMFLFMGIKRNSLLILMLSLVVLSYPAWNYYLKDYQKYRIMTVLDPSIDPSGYGYNSIQSKIAVGSGKLTGKGFVSGSQTQLRFVPEQHTDFIFSVLAEEWGFTGSVFTLFIYLLLILYILDTASLAKDKFSMLTALGIGAFFFWHALINLGMVLGFMPVIGVPLLLISYGGSSVLASFIALGIVLSIRIRRKPIPKEEIDL